MVVRARAGRVGIRAGCGWGNGRVVGVLPPWRSWLVALRPRPRRGAAEVRGVTLTYKLTKPRPSEVAEGAGIFSYEFGLHNPGRLPITEVNVDMQYPGPVRRIQSDRVRTVGPEKALHNMFTASVAAHDGYTWTRHLRVPIELWDENGGKPPLGSPSPPRTRVPSRRTGRPSQAVPSPQLQSVSSCPVRPDRSPTVEYSSGQSHVRAKSRAQSPPVPQLDDKQGWFWPGAAHGPDPGATKRPSSRKL